MVNGNKEAFEIDLQKLFFAYLNKWWLLLVYAVTAAALIAVFTVNFITPMYTASVTIYVNNAGRDQKVNYITGSNLETSKQLVNTYIQIMGSDSVLEKVSATGNLGMEAKEIRRCMHAAQKGEAEIFAVKISHPDPQMAAKIANAIAEVAPGEIESYVEGSSTKVIDYAKVPKGPSSPNLTKNIVLGGLIGGLLAVAYITLIFLLDVRIKDEEELAQLFGIPVLGQIPGFGTESGKRRGALKHGAYETQESNTAASEEKKGRKEKSQPSVARKKNEQQIQVERDNLLSAKSDFFIREAYKTLRTNVSFTLTGEEKSKVIVVTSSMQGEGKSITAINLAISYAMTDKKVLLIDCDMRRPKLARLLGKGSKVGLSNLLMEPDLLPKAVQHTDIEGLEVILAGNIPPNPSELLGSTRMRRLIAELKETYDYIFLDSPPVNMVTDAVVLAPQSDGVLFLVRANQSERGDVIHAVEQMERTGSKILGFVLNDADMEKLRYSRRKRYKRYFRYGRYGYYGQNYRYGYSSTELYGMSDAEELESEKA